MAEQQPSPLALAKIHLPPKHPHHLHRPRLVDALFAQLDKRLFLVNAPAGYGKTSLVVDFAHEAEFPVAWYRLDEFDNVPQVFLEYLLASIRVCLPGFGATAVAALQSADGSPESLQVVVNLIANDLFHLSDHLMIVLDNYQMVTNPLVDQLVSQLLKNTGENWQLCLTSRIIPRIPDQILLVARQQAAGLSVNELRFTPREVRDFIWQNYELDVSDRRAQELIALSDGWIAALLLMGLRAGWRALIEGAVSAPAMAEGIYDYLAEQILSRQPQATRRFLLGSSVPDTLSAELLNGLPGLSGAEEHLQNVQTQQLFIAPLGGNAKLYAYHPLFREFLKTRLRDEDPLWFEQLSLASARQYQAQGHWERAVETYLSFQRIADAAAALEAAEGSLRTASRISAMARWLDALPFALTQARPRLLGLRARAHWVRGELEPAAALFDRAAQLLMQGGEPLPAADCWVWKCITLRVGGHYREAIAESERIATILTDDPEAARVRAANLHARAAAEMSLGDLTAAREHLTQASDLFLLTDDLISQANIQQDLGVVARAGGRLADALEHYSAALHIWDRSQNPGSAASTLNSLGYLYYLRGETEEAEKVLKDARARARKAHGLYTESYALASLGDLAKDSGDYPRALELFRDSLRVAREAHNALIIHYGQMALSHVYGLMGDFGSAHQWLDAAAEDIEAGGSSSERGQLALCRVRLAVDQGRLADALDGAATATALLRQGGDKHLEALAEFHLAHVLVLLNRQDEAVPHLTRVAGLLAVLGYDHFIVIEGRRAALTLQFASGLPDVGHAFSRIFDRLRPSQAPAVGAARGYGVAAPATAPTLAVYTLGDERFAVADVPGGRLEPTPSLRPQIRELALFLLTRYPKGARQDEVLDLIWPNRSFERAKGALHVAITSIRNTLCPLTYVNGSYTLAPERLWYDVLEFERALAAARRASSPRERITWLEQATKLYGGDYLQRLDAPWALEEQQRLRRLYFDALVALGQACYDEGDLPAALRAYEKAISVEPYQEVAWHGAMLTELRIGNRAAARNRYEELRRLLASELGAKPSIELQALYHQISG